MAYVSALPERYSPVGTLDLCSNVFVDVLMPLAIREFPILLIAGGVVPVVWLAAPSAPGSQELGFVVNEGRSANPAIQVRIDSSKRETIVTAGAARLLKDAMTGDDEARVTEMNLRPLGFDVTGSSYGMTIARNKFARNRIQGSRVGIALG